MDYVVRLQSMVARHLPIEHRFVCLTDRPEQLPDGVTASRIASLPPLVPGWWAKVKLFDPTAVMTNGRVLYLDLDVVVVGDLTEIAARTADLSLIPTEGSFRGRGALKVVKKYNSSVMSYDVRACQDICRDFDLAVTSRLWGDQDWIAEQRPNAETMPLAWFPRFSSLGSSPPGPDARVVLCKAPKNHEAARQCEWLRRAWS